MFEQELRERPTHPVDVSEELMIDRPQALRYRFMDDLLKSDLFSACRARLGSQNKKAVQEIAKELGLPSSGKTKDQLCVAVAQKLLLEDEAEAFLETSLGYQGAVPLAGEVKILTDGAARYMAALGQKSKWFARQINVRPPSNFFHLNIWVEGTLKGKPMDFLIVPTSILGGSAGDPQLGHGGKAWVIFDRRLRTEARTFLSNDWNNEESEEAKMKLGKTYPKIMDDNLRVGEFDLYEAHVSNLLFHLLYDFKGYSVNGIYFCIPLNEPEQTFNDPGFSLPPGEPTVYCRDVLSTWKSIIGNEEKLSQEQMSLKKLAFNTLSENERFQQYLKHPLSPYLFTYQM